MKSIGFVATVIAVVKEYSDHERYPGVFIATIIAGVTTETVLECHHHGRP